MKFILLSVLATIITFFVWNSLKRIFFTKFYQGFPHQENKSTKEKPKQTKKEKNVKWDAETVEYEEVED